jgi:hypothetical protein
MALFLQAILGAVELDGAAHPPTTLRRNSGTGLSTDA